ncbi:hypothetical protein RHMOL_Rhmol11G0107000 [Rhododendron molle]|uniref:Uncharacterized protein n=1 Tax=Rhododendron molle TaxID=49168 RepID=A0ACC0LQX9_RHOML|nr:hypothetical protein RHMOL_Rhmol11G0107000 [Rhododendron molle]
MSDFIPEDVVVGILSRLPTKSLIRFRSVSKLWNSLITSPNFIISHLNQLLMSPKNSYENLPLVIVRQCVPTPYVRLEHYKLFVDTGEEDNPFDEYLEIPFPLKSRRLQYHYLMGYVRGLFCLWEHDNIFLWNRSIRKSVSLPKPGISKKTHGSLVDRLGFGYDSWSNDYKVVRIVILCGSNGSEDVEAPLVQVYSLNAGSWKMNRGAGESFPIGFRMAYSQNFTSCMEGVLHWAAQCRNSNKKLVLSFDYVTSTQSLMEAQALVTDVKRLKHEVVVLQERVGGKMKVTFEVVAKMGPQQLAEVRAKLQSYSPQMQPKDVHRNDFSLVLVLSEKFSHDRVLSKGESVEGKHVNGGTSASQGFCSKDCSLNKDLEFLRKAKAEYAGMLEKHYTSHNHCGIIRVFLLRSIWRNG